MRSLLAVILAVAACGDDGNVNPLDDAPPPPDSPPEVDAPTTGLVTLTITVDALPRVGVTVYFQNADNSLVSATMTDVNGVASATMDVGGAVTAINPFGAPVEGVGTDLGQLKTFAGVKPGDNLVLRARSRGGVTQTNVNVITPEDPGATEYVMFTNCGEYPLVASAGSGAPAGGPVTLSNCGATIDLVIETRDIDGVRASFSWNGAPVTEGGNLDVEQQMVAESATYATAPTTTWMYGNVPANIENVTIDGFLATTRGPVVPLLTEASVTSGSATTAPLAHSTADDSFQVNVAELSGSGLVSSHTFIEWGPPTATYVLAMDAATLLADLAATPNFDVPTRSVTWTTGGTNTRVPDLAISTSVFNRGAQTWRWDIVAPHPSSAVNAVTLPTLPEADEAFNAVEGDDVSVLDLMTAQVPGGYDAIRANALSFYDDPAATGAVGATGAIAIQEMSRGGVIVQPTKRLPRARPPAYTRR